MSEYANFFELQGQTIRAINVAEDDKSVSITTDQFVYDITHEQDCCEYVRIVKVEGKPEDILNSPIAMAEEDSDEIPGYKYSYSDDSHTWTSFYLKAENGASVKIWFLGESNGYYSESVNVTKRDTQNRFLCQESEATKCNKCENQTDGSYGYCPFDEEINDVKHSCNCCDECREQCAMDI